MIDSDAMYPSFDEVVANERVLEVIHRQLVLPEQAVVDARTWAVRESVSSSEEVHTAQLAKMGLQVYRGMSGDQGDKVGDVGFRDNGSPSARLAAVNLIFLETLLGASDGLTYSDIMDILGTKNGGVRSSVANAVTTLLPKSAGGTIVRRDRAKYGVAPNLTFMPVLDSSPTTETGDELVFPLSSTQFKIAALAMRVDEPHEVVTALPKINPDLVNLPEANVLAEHHTRVNQRGRSSREVVVDGWRLSFELRGQPMQRNLGPTGSDSRNLDRRVMEVLLAHHVEGRTNLLSADAIAKTVVPNASPEDTKHVTQILRAFSRDEASLVFGGIDRGGFKLYADLRIVSGGPVTPVREVATKPDVAPEQVPTVQPQKEETPVKTQRVAPLIRRATVPIAEPPVREEPSRPTDVPLRGLVTRVREPAPVDDEDWLRIVRLRIAGDRSAEVNGQAIPKVDERPPLERYIVNFRTGGRLDPRMLLRNVERSGLIHPDGRHYTLDDVTETMTKLGYLKPD